MNDDDIGKALKKADPDVEYPRELRTATKAEYTTRARMSKKPGCPLPVLTLGIFGFAIYELIKNML